LLTKDEARRIAVNIGAAAGDKDPNVFTRPWKIAMPLYRRVEPNIQLLGTPVTPQ
jgi:hypothetical protein